MDSGQETQIERIGTLVALLEARAPGAEGEQEEGPSGGLETVRAGEIRGALRRAILACSSRLYLFGARTGDEALRQRFRVPPSEMMHLADAELRRAGQITVEAVRAHEEQLGAFGYTKELGETLLAAQEEFQRLMGEPVDPAAGSPGASIRVELAG